MKLAVQDGSGECCYYSYLVMQLLGTSLGSMTATNFFDDPNKIIAAGRGMLKVWCSSAQVAADCSNCVASLLASGCDLNVSSFNSLCRHKLPLA